MSLPHTEQMKPRPVYARYLMRRHHMEPGPPTVADKQDAIRILADPWLWADEITAEAERILDECGR